MEIETKIGLGTKEKLHLDSCSPVETPMDKRIETAVIAWHVTAVLIFVLLTLLFISIPLLWIVAGPYLVYYMLDRTPANGKISKRYSMWFRSLKFWKYYCNYFPITLERTVELEPTLKAGKTEAVGPKYIFGYHPHGVGALGAFGAIATEGAGWSKKFPGIPASLLTLVTQFQIPVYRDYLMALGISSVSRKNIVRLLENDRSICIVVGGAMESLLAQVDRNDLVLNKRKGFVKLALTTGNTCLVPIFGFGETNSYNILQTKDGSTLKKIQLWIKENYGFTIPFFYARSVFNYDFGLLPFRTPIAVVVGKPIHVKEKSDPPDQKLVDHYHKLYIEELKRIYEEHKEKYGYKDVELNIAD